MKIEEIQRLIAAAEADPYENARITEALRELLAFKMWAKEKEERLSR